MTYVEGILCTIAVHYTIKRVVRVHVPMGWKKFVFGRSRNSQVDLLERLTHSFQSLSAYDMSVRIVRENRFNSGRPKFFQY